MTVDTTIHCPDCTAPVWDHATIDQRLNKCWTCGLRFDSPEPDNSDSESEGTS